MKSKQGFKNLIGAEPQWLMLVITGTWRLKSGGEWFKANTS
jgi:hypothetical protein